MVRRGRDGGGGGGIRGEEEGVSSSTSPAPHVTPTARPVSDIDDSDYLADESSSLLTESMSGQYRR